MKLKNKKIYLFFIILFIFLIICFSYRFEIMYYSSTALGYDKYKAEKYSFLFTHKPFKITGTKLRAYFNPNWQSKEILNIALKTKKNFINYSSQDLKIEDNNYYLNIINKSKANINYQNKKLEYVNSWENKKPLKVWSINMSNKKFLDKAVLEKESKPVQVSPKICGNKLIYARQDGNIGAVDYQTGKRFWHKKYGNTPASSIRGFFCEYEKKLDTYIILLPTGSGVYCIDSLDGSLISSRCGGEKLGVFESRVSPELINNIVYVATVNPSGLEAYNFLTGKFLWRKDFEVGNFVYVGGGSNPWNNFIIDKKNQLIFINTGSPADRFALRNPDNYKYSGSLLALDLKTGRIVWQFQEHEKDTWNHDFVGQPILSPKKVKGKDIVITLSKSGSVYFIDRNSGLPVLPVEDKKVYLGEFKYNIKRSIYPESLLSTEYYNYLGKDCKNCDLSSTIFGSAPPIIKIKRIFHGYLGGPQWGGASIDVLNNLLILAGNHNFMVQQFHDFIPQPLTDVPQNMKIEKCTSCHNSDGSVNYKDRMIIPSLFLTTKIYDFSALNYYLRNNNFHKRLSFKDHELKEAYNALNKYDNKLLKESKYKFYLQRSNINLKKIINQNSKDLSLGKITAISLNTGNIVWQIPAGTHKLNNGKIIIGSQNFGGITNGENNEGISFFTGSLDKKIYAFNNKDGKYLWSDVLPAVGSALPLVYNTSSERWIFVVVGGRRSPKYRSNNLVAFKQKLN